MDSTRERLLEAARTLFSERGFAGTSTREIAARAGCNLAMITHHFGSKEGLLRECAAQGINVIFETVRELRASDAPIDERIGRLIDFMVDHFAANQKIMRLVHREIIQPGGPLLEEFFPRMGGSMSQLMGLLQDAKTAGRLAPGLEPPFVAAMLMAMVNHYFLNKAVASKIVGPETPELLALLKRTVRQIFLHGAITPEAER